MVHGSSQTEMKIDPNIAANQCSPGAYDVVSEGGEFKKKGDINDNLYLEFTYYNFNSQHAYQNTISKP